MKTLDIEIIFESLDPMFVQDICRNFYHSSNTEDLKKELNKYFKNEYVQDMWAMFEDETRELAQEGYFDGTDS